MSSRVRLVVIWALPLAAAVKIWLITGESLPFNADEAVVALMARHILQGARPIFFYGQAYMGSLDAFLVAAAFTVLGQSVWVIRLVQSLLYLGFLLTTLWLGRRAFGDWQVGALAMLLLAIPNVNVGLYTTVSLGGYGEALLLGNLTLLAAIYLDDKIHQGSERRAWVVWVALGLIIGIGVWAFGLTLVYSLPALLYLVWAFVRRARSRVVRRALLPALWLLIGALVGAAPWLWAAMQGDLARLMSELSGGAILGVEQLSWPAWIARRLFSLFVLGGSVTFGLRPPWEVAWLALPLLPFALVFWLAVCGYIFKSVGRNSTVEAGFLPRQRLLAGVMLTLLLAFAITPFGADPSGRYFVPLAGPLALFAAALILALRRRVGKWAYLLPALVLAFHLWGTVQSAQRLPPGITTQFYAPSQVDQRDIDDLMAFLRERGELRGYSNYWVAYPLAFLSGEELIYTPRLPYHLDFRYTPRDDRYAPYAQQAAKAQRVAYITTCHPDLDDYLRSQFQASGVRWQEARIGDFQVFYDLSRPVRPQDIGLGKLR